MLLLAAVLSCCTSLRRVNTERGQEHVRQGRIYLKQDLPDSALAEFGLALEDDPNLVDAHVSMGHIYYRVWRDFLLAHRSYQSAARLDPNHYRAHYGLALMKHLLGRVADAVGVYLKALALQPDSFEANQHVAAAFLQLGRVSEAVTYGQRAIKLRENHQGTWANLAAAYNLAGHYERAVDAYRRAAEFGEPADPILQGLAYAHMMLGHHEHAIVVLRDLTRRNPNALTCQRLGYCHFKFQQFDDALSSYRAALSIDSDAIEALNGVAISLMAMQLDSEEHDDSTSRDEALRLWRRSVQIRGNQPLIHALIARYAPESKTGVPLRLRKGQQEPVSPEGERHHE